MAVISSQKCGRVQIAYITSHVPLRPQTRPRLLSPHQPILATPRNGQRREEGLDIPRNEHSDVERYFQKHPEEVESLLRGDPEWEWKMPTPGPEFTPIDARCITGSFKLEIKPESDPFRHYSA